MNKSLLLLAVIVLALAGCKKKVDRALSFSGVVRNQFTNAAQEGVTVKLFAQENSATGVVGRAKVIAEGTSDAEGRFSLSFERNQVLDYEVQVNGNGIFYQEFKLIPDDVFEAKNLVQDISVLVVSFAQIHIKNVDQSSTTDKLNIGSNIELSCDCCPKNATQFVGKIDSVYTCKIPAGMEVVFNTTVQDGGPLKMDSYSLVCGEGETCSLDIEY